MLDSIQCPCLPQAPLLHPAPKFCKKPRSVKSDLPCEQTHWTRCDGLGAAPQSDCARSRQFVHTGRLVTNTPTFETAGSFRLPENAPPIGILTLLPVKIKVKEYGFERCLNTVAILGSALDLISQASGYDVPRALAQTTWLLQPRVAPRDLRAITAPPGKSRTWDR